MLTVTIPQGQVLHGVFSTVTGQDAVIDGPGKFAPTVFVMLESGSATINADVTGTGTFVSAIGSNLTFGNSVGHDQTVDLALGATITIDKPTEFKGEIGFVTTTSPLEGPFGEYVDLVGLSQADGYSMKNGLLTITSQGKAIDTLRVQAGVTFAQVVKDAGNVYLCIGYGINRIPGGAAAGTILPQH